MGRQANVVSAAELERICREDAERRRQAGESSDLASLLTFAALISALFAVPLASLWVLLSFEESRRQLPPSFTELWWPAAGSLILTTVLLAAGWRREKRLGRLASALLAGACLAVYAGRLLTLN